VVLHAALPFAPDAAWLISASEQSSLYDILFRAIHSFRMHGFFLIAGILATLSLKRRSVSAWLRDRAERLGIPLFFAACFILPLESVALQLHQDLWSGGSGGSALVEGLRSHAAPGFHWISHLWFLVDLLILSAILALVQVSQLKFVFKWSAEAGGRLLLRHPGLVGGILIALLALYIELLVSVGYRFGWRLSLIGDQHFYSVLSGVRILYYLPFFLLGVLLAQNGSLLLWFAKPSLQCNLLAVGSLVYFSTSPSAYAAETGMSAASGILVPRLFVGLAYRWLNRPTLVVQKLVESSYNVYILHHPIILFVSYLAFTAAIGAHAGFLSIVLATTLTTLILHAILRRSLVGSFLLNGIRAAKGPRAKSTQGQP
jgi:glucans biosynthesis protein C